MSRTKSAVSAFSLVSALTAILSASLWGQAFYGSIVGTVTDQSGASLRGANVTLTNTGTGERHQTQSGDGGEYQFLNLVPGKYRIEVEQSGFKKANSENIEVNVSGTARADVTMQLGDVTQAIDILTRSGCKRRPIGTP